MIGIKNIGTYIPSGRVDNLARHQQYDVTRDFVETRTGFCRLAVKAPEETACSMGEAAIRDLVARSGMPVEAFEALVVVTQNPDRNIPHLSAELHGRLGMPMSCACFDISLGCSGYVYGLSVLAGFMAGNGFKNGVLVTVDPYSKIVDSSDKNTALIFGDAATATLLSEQGGWKLGTFSFGTFGKEAESLACNDGKLFMNGRAVFNFAATYVPQDVRGVVAGNGISLDDVDAFVFHQGSRYIVETLTSRLAIPAEKVRFAAADYGNTVSSSIPLILAEEMERPTNKNIVISGFGLGFSWSSVVLKRV